MATAGAIALLRTGFVSRDWPGVFRILTKYTGRGLSPVLGQARSIAHLAYAATQKIAERHAKSGLNRRLGIALKMGRGSPTEGELGELKQRFVRTRPAEGNDNLMKFYDWCAELIENVERDCEAPALPGTTAKARERSAVRRPRAHRPHATEMDTRQIVRSVCAAVLRRVPSPEMPLADLHWTDATWDPPALRGTGTICAPLSTWGCPARTADTAGTGTSPRIRRSPGAPARGAFAVPPIRGAPHPGETCSLSPSDEIFVPKAANAR
jgi:hypothetical protein